MKKTWIKLGIATFWLAWPALWLYLRGSTRTRLLLTSGGKVLVVRGWLSDGKWHLPGGGLHDDEDPAAGAVRELREETAISIGSQDVTVLADETFREHGFEFRNRYFTAHLDAEPATRNQKFEIADARWMSPEALNTANAGGDVLAAMRHRASLDK